MSVYQAGRREDYDPNGDQGGTDYTGRPYVSVVADGANGLKYGHRYRFVDPGRNSSSGHGTSRAAGSVKRSPNASAGASTGHSKRRNADPLVDH